MNLTALTKRLEALEERKAAEKRPYVAVQRIWDDGKLISQRIWKDGKEIRGYTGPISEDMNVFDTIIVDPAVVINRIIVSPIGPPVSSSTMKN
jgi:hypothetical protein